MSIYERMQDDPEAEKWEFTILHSHVGRGWGEYVFCAYQ